MPDTFRAPDRVNTPLLTLITQQSLDEDYQVVAERRAADNGGTPPPRGRPTVVAAVVVAAFGLLVAVAAVQTSQNEGVASASRASLIDQVDSARKSVAKMQRQIVRLREHNLALQTTLDDVTAEQQAAQARLERLEAATGFGAVHGPGIRVTVDDSPSEAVTDRDLRPLVNGLWAAGAEAIAVNGQRLTARSPIRNSGPAVQVNRVPLSPPYVVEAIGDQRTLQADLMETSSGLLFRDIVTNYGFPWKMDNVDDMTLPAAPARLAKLRYAVNPDAPVPSPHPQKEAPQ